jgi:hypothetical protein
MNANHFKQELLSLEAKLKESAKPNQEAPHHSARHLYFELQRLVHQYASAQVRSEPSKVS